MADVKAAAVKELREKTGAGMMDCKKALLESGGELEQAQDWLRAKGLSKAAKKAGRAAADGLVGLALGEKRGALVEVNAETDFVARNEVFQQAVRQIAQVALESGGDREAVLSSQVEGGTVEEMLTRLVSNIGENIQLRRVSVVEGAVVSGYMHAPVSEGLGKIGVITAFEGEGKGLAETARKVSMHIAASAPSSLCREDMDERLLERERQVLTEQAQDSGRPAGVIEKMIEGRMQKFFKESVLLEQAFVMDDKVTVGSFIEDLHPGSRVSEFSMFRLGEGIEKVGQDFANEVSQLGLGA